MAAAPIVNIPPATTNLLRLLLLGPVRPWDPPCPSVELMGALEAFVVVCAFVSAAVAVDPFNALLGASTLVANLLSPCILLANALRCGVARRCDQVHARHVHEGTIPLRRSEGEKECSADIIAWWKSSTGQLIVRNSHKSQERGA